MVDDVNKRHCNTKKRKKSHIFSRKPRTLRPTKPNHIDDVEETEEIDDMQQIVVEEPLQQIIDIFTSVSSINHINITTCCGCDGVRVHSSCVVKSNIDLPDGIRMCMFDGGHNGVCTTDGVSCVPCIVCHKINDTDKHSSLQRDFPPGDNWLFREEHACPSCLATIGPCPGRYCEFCNFEYETLVSM